MKPSRITGFAAYRKDDDWIPLASISAVREGVKVWLNSRYISGHKAFKIIPVTVTIRARKLSKGKTHDS